MQQRGCGEGKGVPYSRACAPPSADNKIGDRGVKGLSVALAKCPNLHTLELRGQCWPCVRVRCGGRRDLIGE